MDELVIVAHVLTDSVNEGFLPAAKLLGLHVTLLTDCVTPHREYFAPGKRDVCPDEIVACDVFNPLAIVESLTRRHTQPLAVFSNSDHLQTSVAIAAQYFGLPSKDWRTAYRAKNKAEMRAHLAALGIDTLWYAVVCDEAEVVAAADAAPLPCVVKPREGVASQQVSLCHDRGELRARCAAIWERSPGLPLILEEYISGPLYTLETLGDGDRLVSLGGFRTTVSAPPSFVELEAAWGTGLPAQTESGVLDIIRRFGVGFGACHTEYVMTASGPRLIEINYRNIGDYREFLLRDALRIPLFEIVLRLYLGERLPDITLGSGAASIRYFTARHSGEILAAPSAFTRQEGDSWLSYKPLRAVGDRIQLTHSNKDYLGVLRGSASSSEQLVELFEGASRQLAWDIAP